MDPQEAKVYRLAKRMQTRDIIRHRNKTLTEDLEFGQVKRGFGQDFELEEATLQWLKF